jgi:hypothetical protein
VGERLNAPPNGAHGHRKSLLDVLNDVILTGENDAHLSNTDVCALDCFLGLAFLYSIFGKVMEFNPNL